VVVNRTFGELYWAYFISNVEIGVCGSFAAKQVVSHHWARGEF
jgi:hypothetical protein